VRESSRVSLHDIAVVLSHLAERVSSDTATGLDPIVSASLRRAIDELRRHIPGLSPPLDPDAARAHREAGNDAFAYGRYREALSHALAGLAFSPHEPNLHYLAATACFELGAARDAIELLQHVLWIHPGHPQARLDLESLAAYTEGISPWRVGADPLETWEPVEWESDGTIRFELVDPDEGLPQPPWDEVSRALGEDEPEDDSGDDLDGGRRAA
jgi:tetratricopeptide (TPR) repeat protein